MDMSDFWFIFLLIISYNGSSASASYVSEPIVIHFSKISRRQCPPVCTWLVGRAIGQCISRYVVVPSRAMHYSKLPLGMCQKHSDFCVMFPVIVIPIAKLRRAVKWPY
ncbi:hypothetical protein F4820DRAFT_336289 [Hypoxylon rubiginosum]|uniref:Uncharacterized protein n=1 Tax=Hypoxylon rubiginosum TaxID=110542 RepID=A0ACB9YY55_9PEZI|nr:hypothetical protein F4820DRAFT_336289 [Hypoxylon rubiginosum]